MAIPSPPNRSYITPEERDYFNYLMDCHHGHMVSIKPNNSPDDQIITIVWRGADGRDQEKSYVVKDHPE